MAIFDDHIEPLVRKEGDYKLVNNAADRGGPTYAGISERANPDWEGWQLLQQRASLPVMQRAVHEQYRREYWEPIWGNSILHDQVAETLFSSAVLSGPKMAIVMAQRAIGVPDDGIMGPVTMRALNATGVPLFMARFALARIARYVNIVGRDPSQLRFLRGWTLRAIKEVDRE